MADPALDTGFDRPDLAALIASGQAQIEGEIDDLAVTRRSRIGVLNAVFAGALDDEYTFLKWLSAQYMADRAIGPFLDRHGSLWGIARKAASQAVGTAALTVTGTDGSAIPVGSLWATSDGVEVEVTTAGVIAGGTADLTVRAVEAGVAGNLAAAARLFTVEPIDGIDAAAVLATGLSGGADEETDARYRARILARIRRPPQGGAAHDYEQWTLATDAAITRAWAYGAGYGTGAVIVRFVTDDDPSGPIPDAALVEKVQTYIDARRPVTADVTVSAPIAAPLDLSIQLKTNTGEDVQVAVAAELADMIRRESSPGSTVLISHIREAISVSAGEHDHVLSVPAADVTHDAGNLPTLGTITWL